MLVSRFSLTGLGDVSHKGVWEAANSGISAVDFINAYFEGLSVRVAVRPSWRGYSMASFPFL